MTGSATYYRQRIATGGAVVIVHLAFLLCVIVQSGPFRPQLTARPIRLVTVATAPPPRPSHRAPTHRAPVRASAPSARVPAPVAPAPPPIISSPAPAIVPIMTADASDAAGAGDRGQGTGGGSGGDGAGQGGMPPGTPPARIGGRISDRDYPPAFAEAGIGGTVSVRYRVDVDGRARDCIAAPSSGYPALDAFTCGLIERRFRFRPARDERGRMVASTIVENHTWMALADRGDTNRP